MEILTVNYPWEYDSKCDGWEHDGRTIAVIKTDYITIPLCFNCLKEMNEEITKILNQQYCLKCTHYVQYGDDYSSCKKKAEKDGKVWDDKWIGYSYCVKYTDKGCEDFELKERFNLENI